MSARKPSRSFYGALIACEKAQIKVRKAGTENKSHTKGRPRVRASEKKMEREKSDVLPETRKWVNEAAVSRCFEQAAPTHTMHTA